MKNIYRYALVFILFSGGIQAQQKLSQNTIRYMVSFDSANELYTAWVVPDYNTPNSNNPDTEEKGATAQFSLKVPKGFEIKSLKSIKGDWDKSPSKIGSEAFFKEANLETGFEYYIIGKAPTETNYGNFKSGEPVALFTFKANRSDKINVLESNDSFVTIVDKNLSLNVASSFYSRSGQAPKIDAMPLEQYKTQTTIDGVLKETAQKLNETSILSTDKTKNDVAAVIAYPNPASEELNVKFFAKSEGLLAHIYLINTSGNELQYHKIKSKLGFNELNLKTNHLPDASYIIKTVLGEETFTLKIVKISLN
jgi:Secretion system C-terminal sorting domain